MQQDVGIADPYIHRLYDIPTQNLGCVATWLHEWGKAKNTKWFYQTSGPSQALYSQTEYSLNRLYITRYL